MNLGPRSTGRRVFYNNDGGSAEINYRGPRRAERFTDRVTVLRGTPITTLVQCIWIGGGEDPQPGADESVVAAREAGIEFIPSVRMNDGHFAQRVPPWEQEATEQFWLDHQDLIISPGLEWEHDLWGQFLLNFAHEEVREHRLQQIRPLVERYAVDGFELDFTRHYFYFPEGQAQPELITDLVRQVRALLDARGEREGKRLPLLTRLAGDLRENLDLGLDPATWVREGLVDYLIPSSPMRMISFDMPLAEWGPLVEGTDVEVHVSPDSGAPRGDGQATLEMYRAAASNYYQMGVDGFYFFNLFCRAYPLDDAAYAIMAQASHPAALTRQSKHYLATYENWRDDADTLPVTLDEVGRPGRVGIYVGDDLATAREEGTLRRAGLRLRLFAWGTGDDVEIKLNGEPLDLASARLEYPAKHEPAEWYRDTAPWTYEREVMGQSLALTGPGLWIEFDARDLPVRPGDNLVEVTPTALWPQPRGWDLTLVDVDLIVEYDYNGRDGPATPFTR